MSGAPVLGIDPGVSGAAVLLDEQGDPCWALRWVALDRKAGRVYRIDCELRPFEVASTEVRSLAGVGAYLGSLVEPATAHVAIEGLFVASMARQGAALDLGRSVGWLTAYVREYALSYDDAVTAGEWRPAVLGCPRYTDSKEAERLALLRWRKRWGGELSEVAACAEADCIAWHRRTVLRLQAAQPALLTEGKKRRRA